MSLRLHGPFPLDFKSITNSAHTALGDFTARVASKKDWLPEDAVARPPGLYLLLAEGTQTTVAGFWLVFGVGYFEDGASGPPDRSPPYVASLLEATVEAVWWRSLPVSPKTGSTWRPLVVLEWPSSLAIRAATPPPGVAEARAGGTSIEEAFGNWLDPTGASLPDVIVEIEDPEAEEGSARIPKQRSLLTVARAVLSHSRSTHTGKFYLLPPEKMEPEAGGGMIPFDTWSQLGATGPLSPQPPAQQIQGPALELPRGGAGFALTGWLTRNLDLWPARASDLEPGDLTPRDVRSPWAAQLALAVFLTFLVVVPLLALSVTVQAIAQPRPKPTATKEPPAAQPAISVCSPDHQKFMEEFRCQVLALSRGASIDDPVCNDLGSPGAGKPSPLDLQAEFCGLLDRELDGNFAELKSANGTLPTNFADLAASQACFNVLGYPDPYRLTRAYGGPTRVMANPEAFYQNQDLLIRPLEELTRDLTQSCAVYRERMERRVEGSIYATHVGTPAREGDALRSEPGRLRESLLALSTASETDANRTCFRAGADEGLEATDYTGMCGSPDGITERINSRKVWRGLGGDATAGWIPAPDLISRYVNARFGVTNRAPTSQTDPLWTCHINLIEKRDARLLPSRWDLLIPVVATYDINRGAIQSQVVLDAALLSLQDGLDAGSCWSVVGRRLSRYTPVHPLLKELDDKGWPSPEQQLCGQICAASYRVKESPGVSSWLTPGTDLELCVDRSAPVDPPDMGRNHLDVLRVPWNGSKRDGWSRPTADQICAFNLVAQDYMPSDAGYLVGGKPAPLWAGETASGSQLAGGPNGLAYVAAENLSTYGRSRSVEACGAVATQCFTSLLMETMGDQKLENYQWLSVWNEKVAALPTMGKNRNDTEKPSPWCALIQPYVNPDGELPEGQFDYPCAKGVNDARANVENAIRKLAGSADGQAKQE